MNDGNIKELRDAYQEIIKPKKINLEGILEKIVDNQEAINQLNK